MAARVVLRGCATFTAKNGESWRKNQGRVFHNVDTIAYYRLHPEFTVTETTEAPTPKRKPPAEAPPVEPTAPTTDADADANLRRELSRMTKAEIVEAAKQQGLELDESSKKDDLISAYLAAKG